MVAEWQKVNVHCAFVLSTTRMTKSCGSSFVTLSRCRSMRIPTFSGLCAVPNWLPSAGLFGRSPTARWIVVVAREPRMVGSEKS
jgi:hypothetical protein